MPATVSLITSYESVSSSTSMPRSSRCALPSRSLSISSPSNDCPMRLPTIPGYAETRLPPASAAAVIVMPFSYPACASIVLASVIPDATEETKPKWFAIWALAAISSASSPPPPEKPPVRRSETNGHMPKSNGLPGRIMLTTARHASVSA